MVVKSFLKPIAVAALLAAAGSSHAVITVYTTQASFLAAVSAPGVNTFSSLAMTTIASPMAASAGPYGFTGTVASALATPQFYGVSPVGNAALSTNDSADVITFSAFTGGVRGAGGNFFGSDINGDYLLGNMTLSATDASGTVTRSITGATTTSFIGFVSNTGLTALTVAASTVQPNNIFVFPTVDNLTLAAAVPVPEPQTYAMLFAGLGVIGFMARRRRG